ncbi:MAG: PAS domain S-box protein [Deltaproteobacteria bacterium]|nr:PAS domain S-box protein [Deltaproteobacteria bacterium]
MNKFRSMLNYLVIAIMAFMIAIVALFVYTSIHLKNKVIFRTVQQTELVSELIARSAVDIMSGGHGGGNYSMILANSNQIGVDYIGIFRLSGDEATFGETGPKYIYRKDRIGSNEKDTFLKSIETLNSSGFFDSEVSTYSRYVPLKAEGPCLECHTNEGEVLGVLKLRLSTESDFELLNYMKRLIWAIGLIICLPVGALFMAGLVIRDKNRIYAKLEESNSNLRRTYNDLHDTEYYLQMILDNSRVIIVTTDTEGRIVKFNKEAEALLEYKKEEVVGKDVLMLYENSRQRSDLMNRGQSVNDGVWEVRNRDVRFRSKSGKIFHISLTLSTMINDSGKIIGTVGIGKDVSEQKMLQFKILQSEKLAGIGTLASGIAHEINNPLAGILGMAEAVLEEDDLDIIRSHTKDIIQYTINARDIVRELSIYSRSAQNMAEATVDIAAVIDNSVKMARHSASFSGIELISDLHRECVINANPVELQQVFVNLIVNAIHAMEDRGTLTLRCWREGSFIKAKVSDTGQGISEKNLSQIYDPFFTTKPVGMGTGLGLYVVYRIVTKYGGAIDVESKADIGTAFTLRFPAAGGEAIG